MATLVCRVQLLDDTDPFNSTNFPEPTRPPLYTFREDIPLATQLAGVHRLLRAPQKVPGEGGCVWGGHTGRRAAASPREPGCGEDGPKGGGRPPVPAGRQPGLRHRRGGRPAEGLLRRLPLPLAPAV